MATLTEMSWKTGSFFDTQMEVEVGVERPVRVFYDYSPQEDATLEYPGCDADVDLYGFYWGDTRTEMTAEEVAEFKSATPCLEEDIMEDAESEDEPEVEFMFGPSREGSRRCQSGSIASGGSRAYCTCDVCF